MKSSSTLRLILLLFLTGCNFNYSESGKQINAENDGNELLLAKRSLQFIAENKIDSLKMLLNDDVLKKPWSEQLEWLFTNGKRIISNNEYPNDSIITVSYKTTKSILKEELLKEFTFPFINKKKPDSTMYFKISIAEGKIYKLMLSTGMSVRKIN